MLWKPLYYRYGNYSQIDLGRGPNGVWTYALHYSFGTAGGGYSLSVYGKHFKSREDALSFALNEVKIMMTKKVGSTDTTNDKQSIILKRYETLMISKWQWFN